MNVYNSFIDDVVECPYNKNHRIARSRIQGHIVKCEKNFPEDYMEVCPYNATHRLFKSDMPEHIATCPMRKFLQPELYQRKKKHGSVASQVHSDIGSTINDENWDEDRSSCRNEVFMESVNTRTVRTSQYAERQFIQCSAVVRKVEGDAELRAPLGFSEAIMVSGSEESNVEDLESVISLMGIGRGIAKPRHTELLKRVGLGRGRVIPSKFSS